MKLYQEQRIQGLMLLVSLIGIVTTLIFLFLGVARNEWIYLVYAGIDLSIVATLISKGQRWTQETVERVKKIREGGGDKADLEWLKTRKK